MYLSVLGATGAGIVGMGLISTALLENAWPLMMPGLVLVLLGLWWAGQALRQSITYHRTRLSSLGAIPARRRNAAAAPDADLGAQRGHR
ncbi:MAG: hypothetical protein M1118_02090 [Chloroflexi bacterium]|nr:hypothetical protein [Chloroflexota bacterium]